MVKKIVVRMVDSFMLTLFYRIGVIKIKFFEVLSHLRKFLTLEAGERAFFIGNFQETAWLLSNTSVSLVSLRIKDDKDEKNMISQLQTRQLIRGVRIMEYKISCWNT